MMAAAVLMALTPVPADAQSRTARTVRFDSAALGGQATFAILLPPEYDTSSARYPVVYLLHGGTQNHTAFPARRWFADEVLRRRLIVVMPHTPQATYASRAGSPSVFEAFITRDLVDYVDTHYRTVARREGRAIGGLSMGGYGAVLAGLLRPDRFAVIGAFSGAFSDGRTARITGALEAMRPEDAPYVYLACGVEDAALPASRALAATLRARNIAHEYREVPGAHSWDVWDPQTLAFLEVVATRPGFPAVR